MTPELFSDAMNEIGAKYVEEALTYKRLCRRQSRCAGRYDPLGGNVDGLAGLL